MIVCREIIYDKGATLPGQTKYHGQNNRTSNQVNGRESEILKITMEPSIIAIEKKNIASVDRLCNTLKKNVDEVHDLKIMMLKKIKRTFWNEAREL